MALPPDLARLPDPTQGRRSNRYRGLPSRRGRVTRPRKSHQALIHLGLQKLFKGSFNDGRFGFVRVQSLQRGQRGQRARLKPVSHLVPCKSCQFYHPLPLYHCVLTSRKPRMYNCCVGSAVPAEIVVSMARGYPVPLHTRAPLRLHSQQGPFLLSCWAGSPPPGRLRAIAGPVATEGPPEGGGPPAPVSVRCGRAPAEESPRMVPNKGQPSGVWSRSP